VKLNPATPEGRTTALAALALAILGALVAAWRVDAAATSTPPDRAFVVNVIGEAGYALPGATVAWSGGELVTGNGGTVSLDLRAPELMIVSAPETIAAPVVVGSAGRSEVTVRLWNEMGPSGTRTVLHFGGDFMMGRRYLDRGQDGTALVTDEESARDVVASIAPLFALADLSSVNYESVAGTLLTDDAAAGKRFLLESPPESIAALDELGVDVATLGNNHAYDWLDPGLISTIRALDAAGIAHPGAGLTRDAALQPVLVAAGDQTVGFVSMTTVTGDYVNDHLPAATAIAPADLLAADAWQYESRTFGFGEPGDPAYVPAAARRPGEAWVLFDAMESELSHADDADLWQALIRVYPELQDWVARRGHGGAAQSSREAIGTAVDEARSQGADLVVVEIHGGLQFADVPSEYFTEAAHAAVDAGADLVIGHHPHVIQGFEVYNGVLVAHSLGNFTFDQDFLSTHPSVVLRTIFEGDELIDAEIYPIVLDGYRPVAVGGTIADRIIEQVNAASLQPAVSVRLPDLRVGSTPTDRTASTQVVNETGTGIIVPVVEPDSHPVTLTAGLPLAVSSGIVRIDDAIAGLAIGTDLFGFGDLEDATADGRLLGGLEWRLPGEILEIDETAPDGPWTARLDRTSQHLNEETVHPGGRLDLPAHRWFDATGAPLDGPASYSIRVWARRVGAGIPFARVTYYAFDDTDPASEPESIRLDSVELQVPVPNDDTWHEVWLELPAPPEAANSVDVAIGLAPPESQSGTIWVDGLQFVEWRDTDSMPPGSWTRADYLLAEDDTTVPLTTAR
jgi:poly-gamma-glutamate capsule biosynthesis protein CapA/YwtB (metallophosphatase superfamily)